MLGDLENLRLFNPGAARRRVFDQKLPPFRPSTGRHWYDQRVEQITLLCAWCGRARERASVHFEIAKNLRDRLLEVQKSPGERGPLGLASRSNA